MCFVGAGVRHDLATLLAHGALENRKNEVTNRANEESVPATCTVPHVAYSPAAGFTQLTGFANVAQPHDARLIIVGARECHA